MNKVRLHFDLFNGKLMTGCNHERNLYHPEKTINEKLNIEDLFKSLSGSSIEKSPNISRPESAASVMTIHQIWPSLLAYPVRCLAIPSVERKVRGGLFCFQIYLVEKGLLRFYSNV